MTLEILWHRRLEDLKDSLCALLSGIHLSEALRRRYIKSRHESMGKLAIMPLWQHSTYVLILILPSPCEMGLVEISPIL
jgi:hypothetical protein